MDWGPMIIIIIILVISCHHCLLYQFLNEIHALASLPPHRTSLPSLLTTWTRGCEEEDGDGECGISSLVDVSGSMPLLGSHRLHYALPIGCAANWMKEMDENFVADQHGPRVSSRSGVRSSPVLPIAYCRISKSYVALVINYISILVPTYVSENAIPHCSHRFPSSNLAGAVLHGATMTIRTTSCHRRLLPLNSGH